MITEMTGLPASVAAFTVTGKVTYKDYENVVIPAVDRVAHQYDKVRFLLLLETDISNYNIGAIWDDLKVGIKHLTKWEKMAIVTDQEGVNKFTDIAGKLIPGETRSFTINELDAAKKWIVAS